MIIKSDSELKEIVSGILQATGVDKRNTDILTEHLVLSNLRGVDTHGIIHLPMYISNFRDGLTVPDAWPEVIDDGPSSARVKGNLTIGHVSAQFAMELAIEKSHSAGVSLVSLVQTEHIGRVGHYAEMAAAEGMASIIVASGFSVGGARAVPFGGRIPALDTNPIGIGIPAGDENPIIIDYATTALSGVKVANALRRGESLPPGCIVDKDGNPTTDPNDYENGGSFMAFGGHKGYALMVAVEFLGFVLAGAKSFAVPDKGTLLFQNQGVTMIVFKTDLFQPTSDYSGYAREVASRIRNTPPAPGHEQVFLPGDIERQNTEERRRDGIPIHEDVWEKIEATAEELGVAI